MSKHFGMANSKNGSTVLTFMRIQMVLQFGITAYSINYTKIRPSICEFKHLDGYSSTYNLPYVFSTCKY